MRGKGSPHTCGRSYPLRERTISAATLANCEHPPPPGGFLYENSYVFNNKETSPPTPLSGKIRPTLDPNKKGGLEKWNSWGF